MTVLQGIDIVSVKRIEGIMRRQGDAFARRVFSKGERDYCEPKRMKYEHYAARFAAKEAFIKTIKLRKSSGIELKDIEVCRKPSGKPYLKLASKVRKALELPADVTFDLSMSHERDHAVATVIAVLKD